ncbi:hypothetical protein ASPNIDRAFT_44688 [Aspergillus niger ATCC 1015]|uniref:Uncharacterized protein n=1 Tax=Aspergillus niger (strain ATCC 1015 / CBS 113.46 / FGSC A1144 / LSHB Ac4 / NCTC 3858a / NRRL 328 / USDA 3528.7) TaxID=380704 RepID=G3XPQ6_ASPNA|nr:hypothetical protein ASPNIDRAFT_44688 [Aspergillus niger ATCC 1015]
MNLNFFSCFSFFFFHLVVLFCIASLPSPTLQCLSSYCEELHCRPWWPPTDISDCLSIAPIRPPLLSSLPPPLPPPLLLPLNPPTTPPNTAAPTSKSSPLLPSSPWAPVPTSYL